MEARRDDDRVDLAFGAVLRDDAARGDAGDAVGDEVDVRPVERGVIVVRDQHALAADTVVRRDLPAQFLVADLPPDLDARGELERLHEGLRLGQTHDLRLAGGVLQGA